MRSSISAVLILTAWAVAPAIANEPSLGSAASFAVLGGSSVTNRGATRVTGNVGVSPGGSVSGFTAASLSAGEIHRDDALAGSAQRDVRDLLVSGACTPVALSGTVAPGNYCIASLPQQLTLDGGADAVWIFRASADLRTAAGSSIVLMNGATASHVFWQVAGSVTLAPLTRFAGNILATGDITLESGATLYGRALARGAVTLDGNVVTLCCDPITLMPLTSARISAAGGTAPLTFVASALPPGWSLSSAGVLASAFTPNRVTFIVTATDANGCTGSRAYSVVFPSSPVGGPTLSFWLLVVLGVGLVMVGVRMLP
ncbi:MAG: Antifreeze protein [Acidobacteria bacterium]|nr:Antifreeze protein [Acidobacteriota bacterium]